MLLTDDEMFSFFQTLSDNKDEVLHTVTIDPLISDSWYDFNFFCIFLLLFVRSIRELLLFIDFFICLVESSRVESRSSVSK